VLCPSVVIEVWFTEIRKHFPALRAYRWYEVAEKQRMAHIRDATLPPKVSDLKSWLKAKCPSDRPQSGATVIISSYETCCSRGLKVQPSTSTQSACADFSLRPPPLSPLPLPPKVVDRSGTDFPSSAQALWIGEHDEPAGALIDIRNEYSTILAGHFHRVVLDEGHKVKNAQTLASNMVMLLKAPYKWILTATPMMNRATDYIGYLHLLWDDEMKLDSKDQPDDLKDIYIDDTMIPKQTEAYRRSSKYDFSQHRLPLWRLDPYIYKFVMTERQVDLSALTAFEVLRGITQLITLRRTQATVLDVNGEQLRIGSRIPRYQICTVEVDFENDRAFRAYRKRFDVMLKNLPQKISPAKSTPLRFMAPRTGESNAMGRNFGVHRRLAIMTLNPGLDQMLTRVSNNYAGDVERWYHMYRDAGMTLYFRATRPLRNLPPYPDRFSFGLYLAKDSPKLMYMAGLVGKVCLGDQGRRVLIYGDFPTAGWNIEGFLKVSLSDFSLPTPLTLISLAL
jgi:SNF2-related domain